MAVLLLQILQWILRIILFLLILLVALTTVFLVVPIRYRAEGSFLEKKPDVKGKITWFFYLIYMKFCYRERFCMQIRVFGFKIYDTTNAEAVTSNKKNNKKIKKHRKKEVADENTVSEFELEDEKQVEIMTSKTEEDELVAWEKEIEAQEKEETELAGKMGNEFEKSLSQEEEQSSNGIEQNTEKLKKSKAKKEKKSFSEKVTDIKSKIQDMIQKVKDIITRIQDGKLKAEHYLELWNRQETQITFDRAKKKFGKMLKAILPRKWILTGEVGFDNPATTGQLMGVLGAMYPILGNRVQMIPNFENGVMKLEGNVKGHIRLGNLLYQLVSLILNRHCFKVIKLVFDELGKGKDKKKRKR